MRRPLVALVALVPLVFLAQPSNADPTPDASAPVADAAAPKSDASAPSQLDPDERGCKTSQCRFTALLKKCAANRDHIERNKIADYRAALYGDLEGAEAAKQRIRAIEPQWLATIDELVKTAEQMSGNGERPVFIRLMLQVKRTCSCDPDPRRPGGWCRRYHY